MAMRQYRVKRSVNLDGSILRRGVVVTFDEATVAARALLRNNLEAVGDDETAADAARAAAAGAGNERQVLVDKLTEMGYRGLSKRSLEDLREMWTEATKPYTGGDDDETAHVPRNMKGAAK